MYFTKLIIKKLLNKRSFCTNTVKPPWRVLFFGTDEFSVYSLRALTEQYRKGTLLHKLEVVSTVKGKVNAVTAFSQKENLPLHKWPPDLKTGQFDVGLVVSFGHLIPSEIIEKFEYGMLNVHASLLPRWRGAAPIIYALANGDTETGITIMRISPKKYDIGDIVLQESLQIKPFMKMSELHAELGILGAGNLVKVLELLPKYLSKAVPQPTSGVTYAPKVSPNFALINWNKMSSQEICRLDRAIDGMYHPQTSWKGVPVKLINLSEADDTKLTKNNLRPGFVEYDKNNKVLKILCSDCKCIVVEKVSVIGKKIMTAQDFNNGYVKKEPPDFKYFE